MKENPIEIPRAKPDANADWFAVKVAELGAELEKLPTDRQDQLERELPQELEG
jgi:hypothetical protein